MFNGTDENVIFMFCSGFHASRFKAVVNQFVVVFHVPESVLVRLYICSVLVERMPS